MWLGIIALAGFVGLGALWWAVGDSGRAGATTGPVNLGTREPTDEGTPELAPGVRAPKTDAATPDEGERATDLSLSMDHAHVVDSADRFVGDTGKIRGHVETSTGEDFPQVWRLVLSPSNTLVGREAAVDKVLDFTDGRQDFEVEGLPLGGYDVRAEAAGMNGQTQAVLLEKRSPSAFVNLRMIEAGFVAGKIVDSNGAPADDVTVTLIELPSRASRETTTDALGDFRFDDVLDGAYQFLVGHFESPILRDTRTLRVQAPGMTLPDIELPPLATLELTVTDPAADLLLPDVEVRGSGANGGVFEGRTDGFGMFTARHLPAGRWRLRLEAEGYDGRRDSLDLAAGETTELTLGLAREQRNP